MKKKTLTAFVDWYILNENRLKSNYYSNYFNEDRDSFIDDMVEIAFEFGVGFGYNPFIIETAAIDKLKNDLANDLKSKRSQSFEIYNKQKSNGVPKALLGKSNYLAFLDFLEKGSEGIINKQVVKDEGLLTYSKEQLIKNFSFRLITQDRLYRNLYYPISVLKKMFYNVDRSFFDNWIMEQINDIILHTKDDQIKFSQIETLSIIKNKNVIIHTIENKQHELHTPIAGKNTKVPFCIERLQDIVIDHVIPFKELFLSERNSFTEIQKIHLGLIVMNDGEDVISRESLKMAGNLYANSMFSDNINYNELKNQLNYISEKAELQLMDRKQNLYKKKYDIE